MAVPHSQYYQSGVPAIDPHNCTHCGQCARICPTGVLSAVDGRVRIDTTVGFGCIACAHCAMVCPEQAITITQRGMREGDLVDQPPQDRRADFGQLYSLMLARRSTRSFSDRPVEKELLDKIVESASTAPMGIPPWDVGISIINGRDQVAAMVGRMVKRFTMMRRFLPVMSFFARLTGRREKHRAIRDFLYPLIDMILADDKKGRDVLFWGAPAVMVFHSSPYADAVDAAIAVTYATLAAQTLGLGSCMIGSAAPVISFDKKLMADLGIPTGHLPRLALILGYPKTTWHQSVRRRFSMVEYPGKL
jgi:ferredoxin